MATARQIVGSSLGQALQRIRDRERDAFLAARPDPSLPLSPAELDVLLTRIWAAFGAAFTPVSPDGTVVIGTQNDPNEDPQLTLRAAFGASTVPAAIYQLWRGFTRGRLSTVGSFTELTVAAGNVTLSDMPSGGQGLQFDGATVLTTSDTSGVFQTTGNVSVMVSFVLTELPAAGTVRYLMMVAGESSAPSYNTTIAIGVNETGSIVVQHEYDGGVLETHTFAAGLTTSKLYCVTVVRSGNSLSVYLNASQVGASQTIAYAPSGGSASTLAIGGIPWTGVGIKAKLASVAFYAAALGPREVTELYRLEMELWGAGLTGTTWYSGSGVPAPSLGTFNDLYLDTATCDVYRKTSTGWAWLLNIKGTSGSSTATAIHETGGPTDLAVGSIPDGKLLKRVGSTVVGVDPPTSAPTGTGWRHVTAGVEDAAASTPTASDVGADPAGTAATLTAGKADKVSISGATGTKLTVNTQGIVTAVASATTADISDSTDKRYVTDAQRTVLTNTSGINTGDQTLPTDATLATSDVTTNDVSTSKHGWAPKLPNDGTKFLSGLGTWLSPSILGGYNTAYSVDFSTLAAQNLLTGGDGNKTIDGKTWALVNSANLTTGYIQDGSHSGLYLRCNANNSSNYGTNLSGGALYATFGALTSLLNGNMIGQYAEVWLWFMFSTPHTPNAATEAAQIGLLWNLSSYATAGMTSFHVQNLYTGGSLYYGQGQSMYNGVSATLSGQTATPQDVFVFKITHNAIDAFAGASSGGAFPARSALTMAGRVSLVLPMSATGGLPILSPGMRVWMSVVSGNTAGAADLLAKKLLLEYR